MTDKGKVIWEPFLPPSPCPGPSPWQPGPLEHAAPSEQSRGGVSRSANTAWPAQAAAVCSEMELWH